MENINEIEKRYIYIMKAISVVSIVAAHVKLVDVSTNIMNRAFSSFLYCIGIIGVCVFFILSGYLFWNTKHNLTTFFYKKTKSIILPWITTGTLVYLYVYLRKDGISVISYLNFITGNISYLYYLSVLIVLYLIFFYIRHDIVLYGSILLSIISNILTANAIINVNPYMNVLNWSCYFCIGLLIAKKNAFLDIRYFCVKKFYIITTFFIFIVGTIIKKNIDINNYWSLYSFMIIFLGILLTFGIRIEFNEKINYIEYIGRNSFSIYLLHMPFAGIIVNLFNRWNLWVLTLLRPLIVIFIVTFTINIITKVAKWSNFESSLKLIIGYKD